MLEWLLELFGEFILQMVLEVLVEFGFQAIAERVRQPRPPWQSAIGYLLLGAAVGWVSLWLVPHHLVSNPTARLFNLFFSPIVAGVCMAAIGLWRTRRGQTTTGMDHFSYGFLFAMGLALARHFWAH